MNTPIRRADAKLTVKATLGLVNLCVMLALLIFLPAGTVRYEEGWIALSIFGAASLTITVYLMVRDPMLLERRTHVSGVGEKRVRQKVIQAFASVAFIATVVIPALDHRFGWSHVPLSIVAAGDCLIALGFLFVFLAMRENSFASALIETASEQTVIDTGPYAVVRHPMYGGGLVLLFGMPLALGSFWGLLALAPMTALMILRLADEEALLCTSLPGYDDYRRKVRYRLIPRVF